MLGELGRINLWGGNMIKGNKQEIICLGCYIAGESLRCRMILREGNGFMSSTTGG